VDAAPIAAAKVCKVPTEPFKQIQDVCVLCLKSVGGIDLESLVDSLAENAEDREI